MPKVKKEKKFELNPISMTAVLVSLCALFLSVYQTQLQRKQAFASVWPHLRIFHSNNMTDSTFRGGLVVANQGVGPAVINAVEYKYNGVLLSGFPEAIDSLYAEMDRDKVAELEGSTNDLIERGAFLSAGQEIVWLETTRNRAYWEKFSQRVRKLEVRIRYSSVYEEQWEVCTNCPDNSLNEKLHQN